MMQNTSHLPSLAVVAPCFNEEAVLPQACDEVSGKLDQLIEDKKINSNSFVYIVDDGSSDTSWPLIEDRSKENPRFRGIKLSRNKGHQLAL